MDRKLGFMCRMYNTALNVCLETVSKVQMVKYINGVLTPKTIMSIYQLTKLCIYHSPPLVI